MQGRARINHGSVHARDPERAAADLAHVSGGVARPFHPCDGAWVCFLGDREDWDGPLIEFYPRSVTLASDAGRLVFLSCDASSRIGAAATSPPRGAGTHFNVTLPKSRAELEAACAARGLACSWRDWQGLLEVWLEKELLIECVPG